MNEPQTDYDSPWKDIVETYFQEFLAFFFPQYHQQLDWSKPYEFLDKELQQVVRDANLGRRLVDKLVKIWHVNGELTWILIHIEIQNQHESDFEERIFVYNYRIFDRYRRTVVSLAILGDERPSWRPHKFGYKFIDCEVSFKFPTVKLLDYQTQWSNLETNRNPFATVVMAHLKAQQTTQDRSARKTWKLILIKRLYERGYEREDIINLFKFIDWLMSLPLELEQEFWQELNQYEEERKMPYVTSVEQIGIEKGRTLGRQEGIEEGRTLGLQEGLQEGRQEGLQEGLQEGRQEGLQEGRQEGKKQGLLLGIRLGLELKFSTESLEMLSEISQIQDLEILEAILTGIPQASSLEEIRQIYQSRQVSE